MLKYLFIIIYYLKQMCTCKLILLRLLLYISNILKLHVVYCNKMGGHYYRFGTTVQVITGELVESKMVMKQYISFATRIKKL